MIYYCDNCGKELGEKACICEGYSYATCSAKCLAHLMLNV